MSCLAVGQQPFNFFHVSGGSHLIQSERTFSLGGLLGQDVAGVGFSELEFPGAGFFEPLGSRSTGLNLRHFKPLLCCDLLKRRRWHTHEIGAIHHHTFSMQ